MARGVSIILASQTAVAAALVRTRAGGKRVMQYDKQAKNFVNDP